jgi:hypothetical protein
MGQFSYKCKVCDEPVNAAYSVGEFCTIYRLENGKVVDQMAGEYDSYGRVHTPGNEDDCIEWKGDWSELVSLHFNSDLSTGFAIIHERCVSTEPPTTISQIDPNQGWGEIKD